MDIITLLAALLLFPAAVFVVLFGYNWVVAAGKINAEAEAEIQRLRAALTEIAEQDATGAGRIARATLDITRPEDAL